MSAQKLMYILFCSFLAIFVCACNGQKIDSSQPVAVDTATATVQVLSSSTATETPTETIVPTDTLTPEPTSTHTPMITNTQAETAVPKPASLYGTIYLSNEDQEPFQTSFQLWSKDNLILKGQTNSSGEYVVENIEPGMYGLWVLVTEKPVKVPGCSDIAPMDKSWGMGIEFVGEKAMSMKNAYLSKILVLVPYFQTPDLKTVGFYAVSPGFEIKPGMNRKMDVLLICL